MADTCMVTWASPLRALGLFCLLAVMSGTLGAQEAPLDWPHWRGPTRDGAAGPRELARHWTASEGVAWRTRIPGRGHSSPIVSGTAIYCTTAYVRPSQQEWRTWARWLTLGLAGLMAAACLRNLPLVWRRTPNDRSQWRALGLLGLTWALSFLVLFGAEALDYSRCPIRTWIASVGGLSLALALTASWRRATGQGVAWLGAVALAVGGMVLAYFPQKTHAFRGGLTGLSTQVAILAALLPVTVGALVLAQAALLRAWPGRLGRLGRLAWAMIAGCPLLVAVLLVYRVWGEPVAEAEGIVFNSRVSPLWALACLGLYVGLAWACSARRLNERWRWLQLLAGLGALAMASLWGLCQTLPRIGYLRYHFGRGQLGFPVSWQEPALFAAALALATLGLWWWQHHRPQTSAARHWLAWTPLILGVAYFAQTNFHSRRQELARALVRLDLPDGRLRWLHELTSGPPGQGHRDNSSATPTPLLHGPYVYAYFGDLGLFCLDEAGTVLWSRNDLPFTGPYGNAVSPVAHQGRLLLPVRTPGGAFLCALAARTGELLWRVPCLDDPESTGLHRTPLVVSIGGEWVLVMAGREAIAGYAVDDGAELWRYPLALLEGDPVASLVADADHLYLSSMTLTLALSRAGLAAGRDIVTWRRRVEGANCVSPALWGQKLLLTSDRGVVSLLAARTGDLIWQTHLAGKRFFASPVVAGGVAYLPALDGSTTLLALGAEPLILSENRLGEGFYASPAVTGGQLLLRGERSLFCVRLPAVAASHSVSGGGSGQGRSVALP